MSGIGIQMQPAIRLAGHGWLPVSHAAKPFSAPQGLPAPDLYFGVGHKDNKVRPPEEINKWVQLRRTIRFYTPIITASLICSIFKSKKILDKWEPRAAYAPIKEASVDALLSPSLKQKIENVYFPSLDGTKLNGWYVPTTTGKPTVVLAHGNFGSMNRIEDIIQAFVNRGFGVFALDYRGYGNSEGSPSEQGLYQDFEAASRFLEQHPKNPVPLAHQIAFGESLGGGVVVGTISKVNKANTAKGQTSLPSYLAVMLSSTFTSLPDFFVNFKKRLGIPVKWFPMETKMQHRFMSIDKMQDIHSPILVVHGDKDTDVPSEMSDKLLERATGLPDSTWKDKIVVKDGAHSGLFSLAPDEIINRLEALLNRVYGKTWIRQKSA